MIPLTHKMPKHRSQTHLTVLNDSLDLMVAETDRPTDAMRVKVCLGTHCAGIDGPAWHRHRRNPIHLRPVPGKVLR